jgi:glycosyltransferase involved in cell wall biosynthesis
VIICVEYFDFLAWTLPFNRQQFDNLVVVTAPQDKKTRALCDHYHVKCVTTDIFYQNEKAFDKGAALNVGLNAISKRDWVVTMDADILLPPRAKEMIERSQPNREFIYGIDRVNCPSFTDLVKYISDPEPQYFGQAFVAANRFDMGARLVGEQGYVPIGFFQMWHPVGSGVSSYCELHDSHGNHSDMNHASQWPRNRRGFIPEVIGVHLSSDSDKENNWRGRRSAPFRPV